MSIEHLIYTSCRTGINEQGSGFQIYSYSNGITKDKASEIERYLCKYKEPLHLPSQPSLSDIENLFPINFTCMSSNADSVFISQSSYIGKDYMGESGRYGNFMSHVHTVPTNELKHYPIQYFNSQEFFKRATDLNINNDFVPKPLDTKTKFTDISIFQNDIAEFIGMDNRIEVLLMLVSAVILSKKVRKKIVICDSKDNIVKWIAAVTMCFPIECAKDLSFGTYIFDPSVSDVLINGVLEQGTAYALQNAQQSAQFFIFDLMQNVLPAKEYLYKKENGCPTQYLKFIETYFCSAYDRFNAFFEFQKNHNLLEVNSNIEQIFNLYKICSADLTNFSDDEIEATFFYASENTDVKLATYVGNRILAQINNYLQDASFCSALAIIRFLYALYQKNRNKIFMEKAFHFYYEVLLGFLSDYSNTTQGQNEIEKFSHTVAEITKPNENDFKFYFFKEAMVNEYKLMIDNDTEPFHNIFIIKIILDSYVYSKTTFSTFIEKNNSEVLKIIIKNISNMETIAMLSCFSQIHDFFKNKQDEEHGIFIALGKYICTDKAKFKALCKTYLSSLVAPNLSKIISDTFNFMIQKGFDDEAYQYICQYVSEKSELYYDFEKNVFRVNPDFKAKYFKSYLEEYKQILIKLSENYAPHIKFMNFIIEMNTETHLISDLILIIEQNLSFSKPSNDKINSIRSILEIKKKVNCLSATPKCETLLFAYSFIAKDNFSSAFTLQKFLRLHDTISFNLLDESMSSTLFNWMINDMLPYLKNSDIHNFILEFFHEKSKYYVKIHQGIILKELINHDDYLLFISFYCATIEIYDIVSRDELKNEILKQLCNMQSSKFDKLSNQIEKTKIDKVVSAWQLIKKEVKERKDSSIFSTITKFFNKK